MNMVEGMCNPVPEMKHGGGNHLEGANYDLDTAQKGVEWNNKRHPDDLSEEGVLDYHKFIAEHQGLSLEEVQDSSRYNTINPESEFYVSPENRPPDNILSLYKDIGWNLTSMFPDMLGGKDEKVDLEKLASDKNKIAYIEEWKKNQNDPRFTYNSGHEGYNLDDVDPVPGNVYTTEHRDYIINDLNSPGYRIRLKRELALDNKIDESEVTDDMLDKVIGGRMSNILGTQEYSGYPSEYTDTKLGTEHTYHKDHFDNGLRGVKTQGDGLPYSRVYYGGDYYDDGKVDEYGGTTFHELIHGTATGHWYQDVFGNWTETPGDLTDYAKNLLSQSKTPHKLKGHIPLSAYSYESDDDEVYTRYKKAQKLLKEKGIYDHTTGEKMTDAEYAEVKKYMNSAEFKELGDWNDIKEFFGTDQFSKWGTGWNEKLEEKELRNIFDNVADASDINDGSSNVMAKYGTELPAYKKGDKDYPDSKQWNKLTKAMDGTEMDTDQVVDKYNLETMGMEGMTSSSDEAGESDGMREGGSVWNKKRYSTNAKKYRRGGESLPKYQSKGQVTEKLTEIERKRKSTSTTGEYYGGSLAGYEIGDIFDFKTLRYKPEFIISYNQDGTVNLDPEVLKWRSRKGFSSQDLLMWYGNTQAEIPFATIQGEGENKKVVPMDLSDGSYWKNKNYGHIFDGENFDPDHPFKSLSWFPKDKSQAHAMSRDLRKATGNQVFFYGGYPFTNEEGDEADIRLGLKAGKQMQELESKLKAANSKSEVTNIMKEFYKNDGKNIDLESYTYINNFANPFKLDNETLMEVNMLVGEYIDKLNENVIMSAADKSDIKQVAGPQEVLIDGEIEVISDENEYQYKKLLSDVLLDKLGDEQADDVRLYVDRLLNLEMDSYIDDHVMGLADHSSLATFSNKSEFTEWTESSAFKQGFWDPNLISYVGANGEIVKSEDIDLPYNTMYQAYKPWSREVWPIDPFDNQPQFRIYSKEQALESNLWPKEPGTAKSQSHLGGLVSWVSEGLGGNEINIPTLWGGSGSVQGLIDAGDPEHNPYKTHFEYYEYDEDGVVTKVHKFPNPSYNSDVSKKYREITGPKGDGVDGTMTTDMHGNQFLNFMHPNSGVYGTEALDDGLALAINPYYTNPDAMTSDVEQIVQPHQLVNMNEDQLEKYMTNLSGKNTNWAHEWNGMNWVGGAGLTYQATKAGIFKAATWKGAGHTLKNYWTPIASGGVRTAFNPLKNKWGFVGATGNSINYGFQGAMNLYDKTSIGKGTGWSVPYTGNLLNINNLVIANWTADHMTDSYDHFSKGEIGAGTYDLSFGLLNSALLYNRAKSAQNWMKFPDLNKTNMFKGKFGNYNLGADGLKLNTGLNTATNTYEINKLGPLSDKLRTLKNFSIREGINKVNSNLKLFPTMRKLPTEADLGSGYYKTYNLFKPQLTQQNAKSIFEGGLMRNQMNQYGDFGNITPKLNLLPSNYNLGDLQKSESLFQLVPK